MARKERGEINLPGYYLVLDACPWGILGTWQANSTEWTSQRSLLSGPKELLYIPWHNYILHGTIIIYKIAVLALAITVSDHRRRFT